MLILNCAHFCDCDQDFFCPCKSALKKLIKMCKFAEEPKNCVPHFSIPLETLTRAI